MTDLESAYPESTGSPGLALWQATNALQRQIRAALVPHELTHVQFVLLASLTWMDRSEPVTQRKLAEFAGTDIMMTSQVIRALEAKGHVTRNPHPSDKRAVTVVPTPEGIVLANRANIDVEAADSDYFNDLAPDELAAFTTSLHKLRLHASSTENRPADN